MVGTTSHCPATFLARAKGPMSCIGFSGPHATDFVLLVNKFIIGPIVIPRIWEPDQLGFSPYTWFLHPEVARVGYKKKKKKLLSRLLAFASFSKTIETTKSLPKGGNEIDTKIDICIRQDMQGFLSVNIDFSIIFYSENHQLFCKQTCL